MGARGPKSKNDLTVIDGGKVERVERPDPPSELLPDEAREWREVLNSFPAEWLTRARWSLMVAYCRHTVAQRNISQMIGQAWLAEQLDVGLLNKLHGMQERESRIMASLAVRLGIAQTTTYEKKTSGGSLLPKPWLG